MAFVIDVFARRIVGGGVCDSMRIEFVLDALGPCMRGRSGAMGR